MTESDIIGIIKEIEKHFDSYKDGGSAFIKHLSDKLLNSIDKDRNQVIRFFLDEIKDNKNGLCNIALQTIIEMNAVELSPNIEKIYRERALDQDNEWKYAIIECLMKLRYELPKSLYFEFVTSFIKIQPDKGYFLLVQYCNVDPDKALPLLSSFYANYLLLNKKMQDFLESRIGFIFSYFVENPVDYFPDLIRQTFIKNNAAGLHLKELFINYLSSNMAKNYPKTFIDGKREELKNLKI